MQNGLPAWTSGARKLQQLLMRTMLAMPVQQLRHQAFHTLETLLQAFVVNFVLLPPTWSCHILGEYQTLRAGPAAHAISNHIITIRDFALKDG